MSLFINIHGFAGCGENARFQWLKTNASGHEIFSPTFTYATMQPSAILQRLSDKVAARLAATAPDAGGLYVIGNSLGAFFARCLNLLHPTVTTLLINPALAPFLILRDSINCKAYLDLFAKLAYRDDDLPEEENRLHVIVGDSDEIIDHERVTLPLLPKNFKNIHIVRGGTHRLELSEEVTDVMKSILSL